MNLPEFRAEAALCVETLVALDVQTIFNLTADCSRGFDSPSWMSSSALMRALHSCNEACVEVFWKAGCKCGVVK